MERNGRKPDSEIQQLQAQVTWNNNLIAATQPMPVGYTLPYTYL